MERVHHLDRVWQRFSGGRLETSEPIHRDHLDSVAEAHSLPVEPARNTGFERPSTMSSSRAGPVRSRTGVRSMMTVT